ncbi:TonB-dependent receptor [Bradyrhizobium sp. HKCCYLS20291]|uniref:TonB-dependent receptor n=1 Tax=Bradyrhizobium sp. HKCCYLS20291 TaxID=3420766 RepID=UPI003EBFB180
MTRLRALKSALLATCALLPTAAFAQQTLQTIEVVGVSPVQGGEIAKDKVPSNVQTMTAQDLDRTRTPSLLDGILQSMPGVSLSDQTGNSFQRDLDYRGQTASPVLGTPQGIAVYQNGTRINEAFGDVVNWDLIPEMAIARMTLQPNNPLFGLNAIGGAMSIEMKNGFTYQGGEAQLFGGSFGRMQSGAQYGWNNGTYSAYIAAEGAYDRGWRDYSSSSHVRRMYADFGARGDTTEFHLSFTGADNKLGSVAATPIEMLNQRWSSVYTWPQSLRLQMQMVQASLKWAPTDTLSFQANGYYRNYKSSRIDGNGTEVEDDGAGSFVIEDAAGTQWGINRNGPVANTLAADTALGQIDRNTVKTSSYGGSLQATSTTQLFGHDNHFVVGASVDHGNTNFQATSELGTIDNSLFVTGLGVYIDQPNAGLAPVNLNAKNTYLGVYATNTFDITSQLALTAGGRFNWAQINLRDQTGFAPLLNTDNNFQRFNPVVGLTYKITPNMTAYAGYSEANRAPTPLELGCSDPNNPCLIDNFLIADPPLKQVVSRTVEGGLRGELSGGSSAYAAAPPPYRKAPIKAVAVDDGWKLRWGISLFRTENSDDIIQVVDPANPLRGYFKNAGTTLRQGVEAKLDLTWNRWTAYANYTFIDATFRSAFDINDPVLGPLGVVSGNHIPGIPAHRLKLGAEYAVTDAWKVGTSINYVGSQYLLHDETNMGPKVPAYWVVNLNTSYQITKNVEVFGLIQNLFNQRYYSAGTRFDPAGFNTAGGGTAFALNDPRSMVPGMPLAAYAGIRAKF